MEYAPNPTVQPVPLMRETRQASAKVYKYQWNWAMQAVSATESEAHLSHNVARMSFLDFQPEEWSFVEAHTTKVMALISDSLSAHEKREAARLAICVHHSMPGGGFFNEANLSLFRVLLQPDPDIDRQLVDLGCLNPRGLLLAGMYYLNRGDVEQGFGYRRLALLRAAADMNCCAVVDNSVWKHFTDNFLPYSAHIYALRAHTGAAALHYLHGWDKDKLQSGAKDEWIEAMVKRGEAWAAEHYENFSWSYDRRWCLLYTKWASKYSKRTASYEDMAADFDFGEERDRYFQAWLRKYPMSYHGVGPKMNAEESKLFSRIYKASQKGKKHLPNR